MATLQQEASPEGSCLSVCTEPLHPNTLPMVIRCTAIAGSSFLCTHSLYIVIMRTASSSRLLVNIPDPHTDAQRSQQRACEDVCALCRKPSSYRLRFFLAVPSLHGLQPESATAVLARSRRNMRKRHGTTEIDAPNRQRCWVCTRSSELLASPQPWETDCINQSVSVGQNLKFPFYPFGFTFRPMHIILWGLALVTLCAATSSNG